MSDKHFFYTDLAVRIGIVNAIILQTIYYWCYQNSIQSGYDVELQWTRKTKTWLKETHPYIGEKSIKNSLYWLEKNGYIMSSNMSKYKFDRGKWYCVTKKTIDIFKEYI